jgi:hypothetical protein
MRRPTTATAIVLGLSAAAANATPLWQLILRNQMASEAMPG